MRSQRESSGGVLQITPQERQALRLLAKGDTTDGVAAALGISQLESEALLTKLFAAMGAGTPAEAVASAYRRGLLTADPIPSMPHRGERTMHDEIEYASSLRRHV